MRLEVRCCCDPKKVLGYLEHPRLQNVGDTYWFPFARPADYAMASFGFEPSEPIMYRLELTVDQISHGDGLVFLAIKNRDYPLEDLKRIPGFVAKAE